VFLDVFHDCARYTLPELAAKFDFDERHLRPCHTTAVLMRIVANVVSREWPEAAMMLGNQMSMEMTLCARILASTQAEEQQWRSIRLRIAQDTGDWPVALEEFQAISDSRQPDAPSLQDFAVTTAMLKLGEDASRSRRLPATRAALAERMLVSPHAIPYCGALCRHTIHGYECVVSSVHSRCTPDATPDLTQCMPWGLAR
jgi:hypothetical protein